MRYCRREERNKLSEGDLSFPPVLNLDGVTSVVLQ